MSHHPMDRATALMRLVAQLQLAYSGELAAAYAYRGHWRSLPEGAERDQVRRIEEDEWHHRRLVGGILSGLGARPRKRREARAWMIGRTLGVLCHVSGWFLPMYGARGYIAGTLTLRTTTASDLDGTIHWSKPAMPNARIHPAALETDLPIIGATYVTPGAGQPVFRVTSGAENSAITLADGSELRDTQLGGDAP